MTQAVEHNKQELYQSAIKSSYNLDRNGHEILQLTKQFLLNYCSIHFGYLSVYTCMCIGNSKCHALQHIYRLPKASNNFNYF